MSADNVVALFNAFQAFVAGVDDLDIASKGFAEVHAEMLRVLDSLGMQSENGDCVCVINGVGVFRYGQRIWTKPIRVLGVIPSSN